MSGRGEKAAASSTVDMSTQRPGMFSQRQPGCFSAPIMFTGAAYYLPSLPSSLHDQFMVLGYHIYVMATQSPDIEKTKPLLYGTVLVLLVFVLGMNLIATLIRNRARARRQW